MQFRVTATNKAGKLGGNFNLYSFDQHLWNEPIDLPKWAKEFYSKFAVLDGGYSNNADKDDDNATDSVLAKRPSGRTTTQAQGWAEKKRDLHLKASSKSSSSSGTSSSSSADKNVTRRNNNSTDDSDGDEGGRPKDEFLAFLKESMKGTNDVLKSFGTRTDQSNKLETLKQCNQLLQSLDKNDPENARLIQKMASQALKNGIALLDNYNEAPTVPAPPVMLPFAQYPPPSQLGWQPLQSSFFQSQQSQPSFFQPQPPFLQPQMDPNSYLPHGENNSAEEPN
jgi:hypothetical protein